MGPDCLAMVPSLCLPVWLGIWGALGGEALCSPCAPMSLLLSPSLTLPPATGRESFSSLEEIFLLSGLLDILSLDSSHGFGASLKTPPHYSQGVFGLFSALLRTVAQPSEAPEVI